MLCNDVHVQRSWREDKEHALWLGYTWESCLGVPLGPNITLHRWVVPLYPWKWTSHRSIRRTKKECMSLWNNKLEKHPSVCPAYTMNRYITVTSSFRLAGNSFLFLSYCKPYKSLTPWIKSLLQMGGWIYHILNFNVESWASTVYVQQ